MALCQIVVETPASSEIKIYFGLYTKATGAEEALVRLGWEHSLATGLWSAVDADGINMTASIKRLPCMPRRLLPRNHKKK